ncbi:hypothetical protein DSM106972_081380 [Dulcicalothrix desertica PCC 7102]|uniref:Uncharacterized protein n=2 Tax=Dulcicalothrix desertica TaxID=32056 RepID=A0A3S1IK42_9CYAN|nr:hypothetical protein DSM106972_081380 [Dulcicalothrix desertica PCC 7102]
MFICAKSVCPNCDAQIIEDVKVGHGNYFHYQIDTDKSLIFGDKMGKNWLGRLLLNSLHNPQFENVKIVKEVLKKSDQVIILNCIDYLYGHCLLKLLNADKHLRENREYGVVVIVQKFMRWMVPEGVSEIWTVDIPLRKGNNYFPSLDNFIQEEIKRFNEVLLSRAYSHPDGFNITNYTRVKKHDFSQDDFRVTFIWREDRIWFHSFLQRILIKLKLTRIALPIQNWKVQRLLKKLRSQLPTTAKFTVTGLGTTTKFPNWIEDLRVEGFNEEKERFTCEIYSESRLVIGVHGSNMLLPSGHAGMTIDLMPNQRWENIIQDVLYQEKDLRLASFRYRYFPVETKPSIIANIASSMLLNFSYFNSLMATK